MKLDNNNNTAAALNILMHPLNGIKMLQKEHFQNNNSDVKTINGLAIGLVIAIILFAVALYIWAFILLIRHSKELSTVALVFGILSLIWGCPLLTIIIVYASK